jgi:predicted O-methyltransferase YrrM
MTHTSESLQAAFHYLFIDEVPELKRLARSIRSKSPRIVNIGAGSGTSTLAFLEARSDSQVIGIDLQLEDSPFGCLVAEKKVVEEAGYADRLVQIHGDSKKIGKERHEAPVDMVFIDGDHSFIGCAGDIVIWRRQIKRNGIMAIHDYHKADLFEHGEARPNSPAPKPWPGVDGAVDMLLRPHFKVVGHVESLIAFRMP